MEELRVVITMIAQLNETEKEVFIWWLIMSKGLDFLINVIALGIICWVIRQLIGE